MKKKLISALKYIAVTTIGLFLLYLAFRQQDMSVLWQELTQANYWWILSAYLVAIASHFLRAYRWQMLIEADGHRVRLSSAFAAVMFGYAVNNAVPRLGEISRCTLLNRTDSLPLAAAIGTVVTERTIDVLILLGMIGAVFLLEMGYLLDMFNEIGVTFSQKLATNKEVFYGLSGAGVVVLVALFVFRHKLLNIKIIAKGWAFLMQLMTSALSILKLERPILFIILSVLIWIGYNTITYCVALAIPSVSLNFYECLIITVLVGMAMVIPSQGGTGTIHFAVCKGFALFAFAGSCAAMGILIHGPQFVSMSVTGMLCYAWMMRRIKLNGVDEPEDGDTETKPKP